MKQYTYLKEVEWPPPPVVPLGGHKNDLFISMLMIVILFISCDGDRFKKKQLARPGRPAMIQLLA